MGAVYEYNSVACNDIGGGINLQRVIVAIEGVGFRNAGVILCAQINLRVVGLQVVGKQLASRSIVCFHASQRSAVIQVALNGGDLSTVCLQHLQTLVAELLIADRNDRVIAEAADLVVSEVVVAVNKQLNLVVNILRSQLISGKVGRNSLVRAVLVPGAVDLNLIAISLVGLNGAGYSGVSLFDNVNSLCARSQVVGNGQLNQIANLSVCINFAILQFFGAVALNRDLVRGQRRDLAELGSGDVSSLNIACCIAGELDCIIGSNRIGAVLIEVGISGRTLLIIVYIQIDGSLSVVLDIAELDGIRGIRILQVALGGVVNLSFAGVVNAVNGVLHVQTGRAVLGLLVQNLYFLTEPIQTQIVSSSFGDRRARRVISYLNTAFLNILHIAVAIVSAGELFQTHVLLGNGDVQRLSGNAVIRLCILYDILIVLRVAAPANRAGPQGVVQQLSRELTIAAAGDRDGVVLEQILLGRQVNGVGQPSSANQICTVSVVAQQNQSHLGCFCAGYDAVGIKLGCRLTGDDAVRIAVCDVALRPVVDVFNVSERSGIALILGNSIGAAVADGVDHLRHFRTGYDVIRTERAIFIALNYAQRGQHIHSLSLRDVSLIRERCRTGKHGERASERQHQCENLFLMAGTSIFSCNLQLENKFLLFFANIFGK